MNRIIIIIAAIVLLAACRYRTGSGVIIKENRKTGSFTGVIVAGDFTVEVKNGPLMVEVEADDNLINDIETEIVNGNLRIELRNTYIHKAHLKLYVSAPEINYLKSSASAEISTASLLQSGNSIRLKASSGSNITAQVDAPEVEVKASSGSEMLLSGKNRSLKMEVSSGAEVKASDLLSENTQVKASSGAMASVYASVKLDASARSGGSIRYKGPCAVNLKTSSGGEVVKQ